MMTDAERTDAELRAKQHNAALSEILDSFARSVVATSKGLTYETAKLDTIRDIDMLYVQESTLALVEATDPARQHITKVTGENGAPIRG